MTAQLKIENRIGIDQVDAFRKLVHWHLPHPATGRLGIKNLRFGDTVTDLIRSKDQWTVQSNTAYTPALDDRQIAIAPGVQNVARYPAP